MGKLYSRAYESELVELLNEYGVTHETIMNHLLCWMSSDDTCEALEDLCRECDIDYEEL